MLKAAVLLTLAPLTLFLIPYSVYCFKYFRESAGSGRQATGLSYQTIHPNDFIELSAAQRRRREKIVFPEWGYGLIKYPGTLAHSP